MIRIEDVLAACTGTILEAHHHQRFSGWAYDSRRVHPGECFVAIRTERGNGHDYIADAINNGASGVLCEQVPHGISSVTCISVPDTRSALRQYAAWILNTYRPVVTGITGSVGKTSTQQMLAAILRRSAAVFDNQTYNDLFGLPIALGNLENYHRQAVLELASGGFGELAELCRIVSPHIGIVTNVALAHMRAFGTLDAAAGEYRTLVQALPPSGTAILNADDPRVRAMATSTRARCLTFGFAQDADVRAERGGEGSFTLVYNDKRYPVTLRLLGAHHIYTALAACAAALALDVPLDIIIDAITSFEPLPGRLRPLAGVRSSTILDDSNSSSPPSVHAALGVVREFRGERIAVLGDMLGLGPAQEEGYDSVAAAIPGAIDHLVTYGDQAARLATMVRIPATVTHTHTDAASAAQRLLSDKPAMILIKGSEGTQTERIVERLMAHPEQATHLLVRQAAPQRAALHKPVQRPAWIEVDLNTIAANIRILKTIVGQDVAVLSVLKADAYGHGALRIARTTLLNGASWLGTATLSEAIALRESGILAPILVMSYVPPWQVADAVSNDCTLSLFSLEVARQLSQAAQVQGKLARCHLKVDTGMSRLGILPDDVPAFMEAIAHLPHLDIEGIYTHFATADDADLGYAHRQHAIFEEVLAALHKSGYSFRWIHAANSAATLRMPATRYNLVRTGIALYGMPPSVHVTLPEGIKPALQFKAQVAQVKQLPPGTCISYGCRYVTERPSTIAVLPVGYGDGFRRTPRNWGHVLIHGRPAPIVGVVCMDMCMVDVTNIPGVRLGDEAVLIGTQGTASITVQQVAEQLGTISYEVTTQLLARVPREPV